MEYVQKTVGTLSARDYKGACSQWIDEQKLILHTHTQTEELSEGEMKYIVRRLTPLECERLQGFPDYWTLLPHKESMTDEEVSEWNEIIKKDCEIKGKTYKEKTKEQVIKWYNSMIDADSHRYQALGNSIATGDNSYWKFIIKRISAMYDREITLGSLFDGIGGFPLIFEQINGKGSCIWASEIEPFCIAVTKHHFGD